MKIVAYLPAVNEIILVHLDRETIEFEDFVSRIVILSEYRTAEVILLEASNNVIGFL
jgi:hypothetical protein